ncbi:asparaginase [Leucobacter sp. OH1287]|uniref:asparaginase n=1 Tax=Leucobacter sp. OH1287 TaxID=2491049 RepID=UPI001F209C84|nr:asparaginase [Leucobacter sp. OH1287]
MSQMPGTFAVSEAVELAVTTRGDFIESRHAGSAIVLAPSGEQLLRLGNPDATFLTRSALKPLQSLAMHTAGLQLVDDAERAISLASHTGTPAHVETVERVLAAANLSEANLLCPESYPVDKAARNHLIRKGAKPSRITMGCSGKHAAMLSTCVAAGWPTKHYTHPEHPLQQHIAETVQRYTGETPSPITVDGCGAPVLGMSLHALARGYRRMATADPNSPFPQNRIPAQLLGAAKKHPELVEGPGEHDTVVMQNTSVFAKYGAEGISAMAAPDGTVTVVKILDGSPRASRAVALSLLTYVGAVSREEFTEVLKRLPMQIYGGGSVVGDIRVSIPALLNQ